MKLIFEEVHLHNFFSYEDERLALNDMGYTLISGRNLCKLDSAYSNGSGKSSIVNAICWAITGETAQGASNGIENIFANPDDCWVELTLRVNNDEFIIRRIKTPEQDLKIYINGEDKSGKGIRESSKLLATYIPDLTPELLNSVIILGQGLPSKFSNNKPSHRKEILEKLTKSDFMIQSIKDKLEYRQTDLKNNLRNREDDRLEINSKLSVYRSNKQRIEAQLNDYNNSVNGKSVEELTAEIDEYTKSVSLLESELDDSIRNENDLNNKRSAVTTSGLSDLSSKITNVDSRLSELNALVVELSAESKSLASEIRKLDSITDICPTCGQKIPEVSKPDTTEIKNALRAIDCKLSDARIEKAEAEAEKNNIINKHNEEQSKLISELNKRYNDQLVISNSLRARIKSSNSEISRLTSEVITLQNISENYNKTMADLNDTANTIAELENNLNKTGRDIELINGHLAVVQQMITLAKREFRGVLLQNVISYINNKVKQYSKIVFGTDRLSFELNENSLDITYCDKPFENLSGGEKQRIDVIIQLALRDILSNQLDIHSNVLVCDEIYDNLDTVSCQRITNLISDLTDVDSVFIISHHVQDLEITYDNNLLVTKGEDGISHLNFV